MVNLFSPFIEWRRSISIHLVCSGQYSGGLCLHQRLPSEHFCTRRYRTGRSERGLHRRRRLQIRSDQAEIRSGGFPSQCRNQGKLSLVLTTCFLDMNPSLDALPCVSFPLQPTSIVSYNHLGNNDGMNLSAPQQFRSKEISKSNVVDDMVESNPVLYKPEEKPDHCVKMI